MIARQIVYNQNMKEIKRHIKERKINTYKRKTFEEEDQEYLSRHNNINIYIICCKKQYKIKMQFNRGREDLKGIILS